MNLAELIRQLDDVKTLAEAEGIDIEKLTVLGYLLGDGINMSPRDPYIDGSTLHLDFERTP